MPALDVILAPALVPDDLLGLELHFLDAIATRQTPPALLIYTAPGRFVSISRYHLYSGPSEHDGINVFRRLTGGRVVGAGQGWLSLALILPTRTALLKEDAARLKPEQIMNRYARGLLTATRAWRRLFLPRPRRDNLRAARDCDVYVRDRRRGRDAVRGVCRA
jgi:lipoate-protein ligase A